jgi:hypothetical protein
MPINLNDPEDRQVATWLAAQSNPAAAVKELILNAVAGQESPARLIDLLPSILQEVRALRVEMNRTEQQPSHLHEDVLYELRALRGDLARVGPKDLGKVAPPPEDPDSARRLDSMFHR